jgi:hypothetical protein
MSDAADRKGAAWAGSTAEASLKLFDIAKNIAMAVIRDEDDYRAFTEQFARAVGVVYQGAPRRPEANPDSVAICSVCGTPAGYHTLTCSARRPGSAHIQCSSEECSGPAVVHLCAICRDVFRKMVSDQMRSSTAYPDADRERKAVEKLRERAAAVWESGEPYLDQPALHVVSTRELRELGSAVAAYDDIQRTRRAEANPEDEIDWHSVEHEITDLEEMLRAGRDYHGANKHSVQWHAGWEACAAPLANALRTWLYAIPSRERAHQTSESGEGPARDGNAAIDQPSSNPSTTTPLADRMAPKRESAPTPGRGKAQRCGERWFPPTPGLREMQCILPFGHEGGHVGGELPPLGGEAQRIGKASHDSDECILDCRKPAIFCADHVNEMVGAAERGDPLPATYEAHGITIAAPGPSKATPAVRAYPTIRWGCTVCGAQWEDATGTVSHRCAPRLEGPRPHPERGAPCPACDAGVCSAHQPPADCSGKESKP